MLLTSHWPCVAVLLLLQAAADSHEKNMRELKARWEQAEADHNKALMNMRGKGSGLSFFQSVCGVDLNFVFVAMMLFPFHPKS